MLEGADQAAGLRRMASPRSASLLAFALASDGGRCVAPLARALRGLGRRPVVLDAYRGAVAATLGLRLRHDVLDLLQGRRAFEAVAQRTGDGVCALRCERGLDAALAPGDTARLLDGVSRLDGGFDDLLLAMPASELACVASPARSVPVVELLPGDGGRLACYGVLKLLAGFGFRRFACIVRQAAGAREAAAEHRLLARVAAGFLRVDVLLAGWLPAGPEPHGPAAARAADTLIRTAGAPVRT